jgi:hypothetical protein
VLLADSDIRRAIDSVQAAFASFSEWEYNNEPGDFYPGFSLWGTFLPDPTEPMPRSFFILYHADTGHASPSMAVLHRGRL